MKRISFTVIFSLAGLLALACGGDTKVAVNTTKPSTINTAPASTPLPAATIDELASGREVYKSNCAACHKENGKGGEVEIEGKKINPDDLTSAKIKGFSDEKIIGYIVNGVEDEGMPAFKGKLSEGQIRDVVKYVRTELQKVPAAPKS